MKKIYSVVLAVLAIGTLAACDNTAVETVQTVRETAATVVYTYLPTDCNGVEYYHDGAGNISIKVDNAEFLITHDEVEKPIAFGLNGNDYRGMYEADGDIEFSCRGEGVDIEHPEDAVDDALESLGEIFEDSPLLMTVRDKRKKIKKKAAKAKRANTKYQAKKVAKKTTKKSKRSK